jgi:hypothetical protein
LKVEKNVSTQTMLLLVLGVCALVDFVSAVGINVDQPLSVGWYVGVVWGCVP